MAGLPCRTSTQAQGVCSRGSSPVPFFGPCTPAPHWPRPCGPVALPSASRGGPALNLWGLALHQLSTVRNLIFFPGAWQCRRTLVRVAESYIVEKVEKILTVRRGDTDCDQAVIRALQKQNMPGGSFSFSLQTVASQPLISTLESPDLWKPNVFF